ncbi:MAG: hypothetical protein ACXWIU_05995 [Limisphaerales bacterium]
MRTPFLALAATLACIAAARSADWVERPYDPPAGSRWIIQTKDVTEVDSSGKHAQTSLTTTAELIFEQKTAEGFRVTYIIRNGAYEGDARMAAFLGPVSKALDNLSIHATIAPNGIPLRVENLDEVQTAARTAIDGMMATLAGKPEAAVWRRMATEMFAGDESRALRVYLGSLATLALGQNTGLHLGETRISVEEVANPLNGVPIKSSATLRIDNAYPATGKVRLIRTRAFDADSIKAFLRKLVQELAGDQNFDNMMGQAIMVLDSRTELDVEEGMTRVVHQEDTATGTMAGHSIVRHTHKVMTVTRP